LDATDIAVSVNNGVVTLTGLFAVIWKSAKRVAGMLAVANDFEVRLPNIDERPDPEITKADNRVIVTS
jgi:hypothetical protein